MLDFPQVTTERDQMSEKGLDSTPKTFNRSLNTLTNKNADDSSMFQQVTVNLVSK